MGMKGRVREECLQEVVEAELKVAKHLARRFGRNLKGRAGVEDGRNVRGGVLEGEPLSEILKIEERASTGGNSDSVVDIAGPGFYDQPNGTVFYKEGPNNCCLLIL